VYTFGSLVERSASPPFAVYAANETPLSFGMTSEFAARGHDASDTPDDEYATGKSYRENAE